MEDVEQQSPQLMVERPGSSQGRKRAVPSLAKELDALMADEHSQSSMDTSDGRKKRRMAAITSEIKSQQGMKIVTNKIFQFFLHRCKFFLHIY